jgi:LacI family transcriptional regulator
MGRSSNDKRKRVAISIEMEWGFKRHLEIYAGSQRFADESSWDCTIHPAIDRALNSKGPPAFDGIIARATSSIAAAAAKARIPVVNVWLNSPVTHLPGVYPDFRASGTMAAEHLLGRGFRNFGHLGFLRDIDAREQHSGFHEAITEAGFTCESYRFPHSGTEGKARGWEQFISGLESWMDSWTPPVGILVCNDQYARYLIDACRSKGLHIPHDVAIVSTSNEPLIFEAPPPTLTSIDMGFAQVGYQAAALLDLLMQGEKPSNATIHVPPSELIPRQSTDLYAAEDPLVARTLRFIADNSHTRIEVKNVVTAVATNRRSLERKFRSTLGQSISNEITRLRLDRAKRRMVETDTPMKEIALDSGFRDADHLYKVFQRVIGIPPTRFREEHQKLFHSKQS